jgi:hypothetical protein
MTRRILSTGLGALALLAACSPTAGATPEQRFHVTFRAATDDGDSLPGAAFRTGDRLLGVTDSSGSLGTTLSALEGQALPVTVTCPEGFTSPDTVPSLRLARSRLVANQTGKSSVLSLTATCTRESRDVVVLVHADHGDTLHVLVDGKPTATTDSNGVAHILLGFGREVPSFEVRIDTTERRDLKPASPSRTFELTGRDAIVVFEQSMTVAPKLIMKKAQPARHVPDRID